MQNHVHWKNLSNNSKSNPSWSIRTIGKPEDIELRSCGSPCPKVFWRIRISIIENHHQWIINIVPLPIPGPTKIGGFSQGCEVETGGCLSSSDSGVRRPFGFSARGAQETVAQNWPQMKALLEPVTLNPYPRLRCLILWWPCEDAKMLVARLSGWHGVLASVGEFKASVWFFEEQCARRMPAIKHLKLLVFGDAFSFSFRGSQRSLQSEI